MFKKLLQINLLICFIVFYAFLSYGRNAIWLNEYALWNDAAANSQDKVRPHLNFGNTLLKLRFLEKAVQEFKLVKEKAPTDFTVHISLGGAYMFMGNLDGAIAEFQKAVFIRPDSSIAHTNLGSALLKKKNIENAIKELKIAIQLWQENYAAHYNLIDAYKKKGLLEEAEKEAKIVDTLNKSKQNPNIQDVEGFYGIVQM